MTVRTSWKTNGQTKSTASLKSRFQINEETYKSKGT